MTRLDELQAAMNEAAVRYDNALRSLNERLRDLRKQAEARIETETQMERGHVMELNRAHYEAKVAFDAETARAARAGEGPPPPYPVGTILAEWTRRRSYWFSRGPKEPSGRRGRVEVWERGSLAPNNSRFLPYPGKFYIRLLKKDGSDSKHFEMLNGAGSQWLPEGTRPEAE